MKPTADRNRRRLLSGGLDPMLEGHNDKRVVALTREKTPMYVTATAYDTTDQKIAEVGFVGFAEIIPDDLVQEALRRLLLVVPAQPFVRIGITLGQ
jgi:hypothetical protein